MKVMWPIICMVGGGNLWFVQAIDYNVKCPTAQAINFASEMK